MFCLLESDVDNDGRMEPDAADQRDLTNEQLYEQDREHAELDTEPTSAPAILIGIFCLKFALPEKAVKALLELFRLNLDVSSIKSAAQILQAMETASMSLHDSCRNCHADLAFGPCFEHW